MEEGEPMTRENRPGEVVRLASAHGPIERVVVLDYGDVISVCRQETYDEAMRLGCVPATAGFRKSAILADP